MAEIKNPFAPLYDAHSKVLILGTMPSPKSRENGFYYGHPQNRFWRVLAALFEEPLPESNEQNGRWRCATGSRSMMCSRHAKYRERRMPAFASQSPVIYSPSCRRRRFEPFLPLAKRRQSFTKNTASQKHSGALLRFPRPARRIALSRWNSLLRPMRRY